MAAYTTEEKVEAELLTDFTTTTSPTSSQVATFISEAQELIDRRTGTTFGTAVFTDEIVDLHRDNTFNTSFYLKNSPVVSISALYTNLAAETESDSWEIKTQQSGSGGDYKLDEDTGFITFLQNYPRMGKRAVKASGVKGYSTVPGVVSELATKLAASRVLGAKVKKSQSTSVDSISLEGISIRKNIGQTNIYLNSLKKDIEGLWAVVGDMITEVL